MRKVIAGDDIYLLIDKHWMVGDNTGGVVAFASEKQSCLLNSIIELEDIIADPNRNWKDR